MFFFFYVVLYFSLIFFFVILAAKFIFFPVVWESLWNVAYNLLINWFASLRQTNDSLLNKLEKKLADGFTCCVEKSCINL